MKDTRGSSKHLPFLGVKINQANLSSVKKGEKKEILYNYLSGSQFRQKIEAIVDAFVSIKDDLNKEKRPRAKNWSKREKQIEKVILNTAGMYGDMQGIIGAALAEIKILDYDSSVEEIETTDNDIP